MRALLAPVLVLGSGCLLTLDRDEALLEIVLQNPRGLEVELRIGDPESGASFVERLPVPPGPGPAVLPTVSAVEGVVRLEVSAFDGEGAVVAGPLGAPVRLRAGTTTRVALDLATPPLPGGNGQVGVEIEDRVGASAVASSAVGSGMPWAAAIAVPPEALMAMRSRLAAELLREPASLRLRSLELTVESTDPGDDDLTLDEVWEGTVTVRLRGGGLDRVVGSFSVSPGAGASPSARASLGGLDVDASAWLGAPSDAALLLEGPGASDDAPSVPPAFSASLGLWGR